MKIYLYCKKKKYFFTIYLSYELGMVVSGSNGQFSTYQIYHSVFSVIAQTYAQDILPWSRHIYTICVCVGEIKRER